MSLDFSGRTTDSPWDPYVYSHRLRRLRDLIDSNKTEAVINYVRQNPDTTADKVAKDLQEKKVCSRLTTLALVKDLLEVGVITDDRKGKYFHSLSFNQNFKYKQLARTILTTDVKQILRFFDKFVFGELDFPSEDQVRELREYFDQAINEYFSPKYNKRLKTPLNEKLEESSMKKKTDSNEKTVQRPRRKI